MNETMIEKGFTEPTDRVKRLKKMIVEARRWWKRIAHSW